MPYAYSKYTVTSHYLAEIVISFRIHHLILSYYEIKLMHFSDEESEVQNFTNIIQVLSMLFCPSMTSMHYEYICLRRILDKLHLYLYLDFCSLNFLLMYS